MITEVRKYVISLYRVFFYFRVLSSWLDYFSYLLGKFTDFFRHQTRLAFLLETDEDYCLNVKSSDFAITSIASVKIIKKVETTEQVFFVCEIF